MGNLNMSQEDLCKFYKEELKPVHLSRVGVETVPQYLGQLMGEQEWAVSGYKANKKFIYVEAYDFFKELEYIVLVGRTGTGKSSILKKIEYEVNTFNTLPYKDVVFVDFEKLLLQISSYGRLDGTESSYSEIKDCIEKIVILAVIKHITYDTKCQYNDSDLNVFKKYLNQIGVSKSTKISEIFNIYAEKMRNDLLADTLSAISLLSAISRKIFTVDFQKCQEIIDNIFSTKKMLFLIDANDRYDFNDKDSIIVVNSLLSYVFKCYSSKCGLCVKMTLPSELYSELRTQIPSKHTGNTVFIEWSYRDLVKFIATRCYMLFTDSEWKNHFNIKFQETEYKAISNDYDRAKKFLLTFLPERSSATINLSFDTLSYIIRHTQKKPRQLMIIFEAILHKIIQNNRLNYYFTNSCELKERIHSFQEKIILDCLNMYADTYKNIVNITAQILSKKEYIIDAASLDEYINSADLGNVRLSKQDIKRILIESGIIGTVNEPEIHYISPNSSWFQNPNICKIVPALFDYQVMGKLIHNKESVFVIHPLCYEYYNITIDCNCLVYPENYDETDETFNYIMKNWG